MVMFPFTPFSLAEGGNVDPDKPFAPRHLISAIGRLLPGLLFCVLALSAPLPATAQEVPKTSAQAVAGKVAAPTPDGALRTRIEIDQDAGVIRFITGGQERAILNADGLRVRGDIQFTGQVIDTNTWQAGEGANAP